MTGELEITSGGAIAVDSGVVRDIGRRMEAVGRQLEEAADLLRRAGHAVGQTSTVARRVDTGALAACAGRLSERAAEVADNARGTAVMADTFELVELRAEQQALSVHSPHAALALQERIDELVRADPGIEDRVVMLTEEWEKHRFDGLENQGWDLWALAAGILWPLLPVRVFPVGSVLAGKPVAGFLQRLAAAADALQRGVLPRGTRLQGPPPPVQMAMTGTGTAAPARSLKDSLQRIPSGRTGQVVVEKYTTRDGATRFVTYIDGTRTALLGTAEPWDSESNWDLYMQRDAAVSQQAVLQALDAAGARPGDRVDFVGYSQGAAIASLIAMEGRYDTGTVITAGSPVQPSLEQDQLLVELRHRGDPVSSLAEGGSAGGTGAPDSFEVRRTVEAGSPIDPHLLTGYVETAEMVDGSGDPRVTRLHETFYAELAEAETVEVMEFTARRP
ncbi:hypothetical protein [Microbacterium sp.]|uniref:hypothetical protein n=1 Tax=Microbacterium sp. TaxID=51671 RepID=UPI0028122C0B|nr:hypothetical protein [Microbacterium sp.]